LLLGSKVANLLARQTWWEKILTILKILRLYALFIQILNITEHQADACKSRAL
jgi:hypothetical protein